MTHRRRSGLGALIPGAGVATESGPQLVPITAIAVNPYQPRRVFAEEMLNDLADSIRQHGILQPLVVRTRQGGYELIAGERRLQAARKLGLQQVPVLVRESSDEEMLELALVENLQRENLNAMEAAHSYQQLVEEFGLSQAEVAERVGKSRSAVANTLRLLSLPPQIQQAVESGVISEGHARCLLSVDNPERRESLFTCVVEQGISVRELEARVNPAPKETVRRKKAEPKTRDANLQYVESEMQTALATKVRFKENASPQKGVIEIEYYSAEDLERIFESICQNR